MRHTTYSTAAVFLFLLDALAAPTSNRNTGFMARRHRRHFRTNEQHDEVSSASQPPSKASTRAVITSTLDINLACHALLDVYQSMGGHQWTNQQGWNQASRHVSLNASRLENLGCCNWFGVSCSNDGRKVVALELPDNGVRGPISNSIYSLADLQTLNLSSNPLRSKLPSRPIPFPIIDLSHASLSGTIAPSTFQSPLTKILMLSNNTFTGPVDVSNAANLETLFLDTNYFSEVAMGSSQGKKWKNLVMYNNVIHMPLPDLSGAVDLERVAFGNNRFTGSVFDVSRMKKLMFLDLRANQLSGPFSPLQSYDLPNIKLLGISGNDFTGTIELRDASHNLLVAPSTLQKCSIEMQNRQLVLPCDDTPSSYPADTWAGKCGIVQMCKKSKMAFRPMETRGDSILWA